MPAAHEESGSQAQGFTEEAEFPSLCKDAPHTCKFGEVLAEGVLTYVKVLYCGDVKRTPRIRHICVPKAMEDALAEMEADGIDDYHETVPSSPIIVLLNFPKYGKRSRRGKVFHSNLEQCRAPEQDKSFVARGAEMALGLLHVHDLGVVMSYRLHQHLMDVSISPSGQDNLFCSLLCVQGAQ